MLDKLYTLITSDDLTWEGLIRDIVKQENMNPWDINVARLSDRYVRSIRELESLDFRVSGKFLLTAAILLRIKSEVLDMEDLLKHPEYYLADLAGAVDLTKVFEKPTYPNGTIVPRLRPRQLRRVTLDELVNALHKAMEVKNRREKRYEEREKIKDMKKKFKPVNIREKMKDLYNRIMSFFKNLGEDKISFGELLPSTDRKDVILTFVPLLHLSNSGKIVLEQEKEFGDIYVREPETPD
jgi:segregation and condensation protein A